MELPTALVAGGRRQEEARRLLVIQVEVGAGAGVVALLAVEHALVGLRREGAADEFQSSLNVNEHQARASAQ